jgi:electron transfer flavoprotein alpha subunit
MTLVFVEIEDNAVSEMSLEAITFARRIGVPLDALVVSGAAEGTAGAVAELLGKYGVSRVYEASGDAFSAYAPAAWAAAVVAAAEASGDAGRTIVASGTPRGSEVLAHVACRLGVSMAANVVAVENAEPFTISRQVLGGAALEHMLLDDATRVLTVAGHTTEAQEAAEPVACQVEALAVAVSDRDLAARVVRVEAGEADSSGNLKSAKVVVGAGRGAGGPDGFADLLELTELLHGSLGVSRVVTSLGWRPHHEQVGQTGSRISPDLYIPCGISGAIQHWAGCSSAKTILAINSDPDAPMVTKAHYAVIGDLHEVVPAVNAEIRRRQSA